MGDIYRNASRVITYVGPAAVDEKEEERGIDLLCVWMNILEQSMN
jgi:hypothetical protein